MLPYGEEWRKYRKVLHSGLHARRAESYKDMQSLEGKATLRDILLHPEAWDANIQRCVWQSFGEEPQNKIQPFSDMQVAVLNCITCLGTSIARQLMRRMHWIMPFESMITISFPV